MDRLKLAALGERLKTGGAEMSRKVSGKMKEILQVQSQEAKMVDEATSERLEEPNWGLNLRICNLLNSEEFNGSEVMRAIKKKVGSKNTAAQRLSLDLLEACAMNCDKVFSEVASEKVLDEMVRMIDNPETEYGNRRRALQLIEAWGKSDDLRYLPVFEQTYMSLKARKILFSIPDDGNSSFEPHTDNRAVGLPEEYLYSGTEQQDMGADAAAYHDGGLSFEEKKEILVITRNSIEILSSILNSERQEMSIEDDLTLSMLDKCKESQPVIQRIIESIGDDEPLLFEALNLHEELEQVLSRYEDIKAADPSVEGTPVVTDLRATEGVEAAFPIVNVSGVSEGAKAEPVDEKEVGDQRNTIGGSSQEIGENISMEKREPAFHQL